MLLANIIILDKNNFGKIQFDISWIENLQNWKILLESVLDKNRVTQLVTLWYFIHLIGQIYGFLSYF